MSPFRLYICQEAKHLCLWLMHMSKTAPAANPCTHVSNGVACLLGLHMESGQSYAHVINVHALATAHALCRGLLLAST